MFCPNTLYYFFSTLAQILAAIVALIAVLVHFRMSALRDFLIGDGKSILKRKKRYDKGKTEPGYELLEEIHKRRLIDSIERKDIKGIKEVLINLAEEEVKHGINTVNMPHCFQWLLDNFSNTENQIKEMLKISKRAFIFSLITALCSLFSILSIDFVKNCFLFQIVIIGINIILLIVCLYYLFKGISLGLKSFTDRFESI